MFSLVMRKSKRLNLTLIAGVILASLIFITRGSNQLPATFEFDEKRADILYSLRQYRGDCQIHIVIADLYPYCDFRFVRDGKNVFSLRGHTGSVFCSDDTKCVVLFAQFPRGSCGCNVLACDLRTGTQLWKTELHALGSHDHSAYRNQVNIGINAGTVVVAGRESYGDYMELLDQRTGRILAHKIYRKDFR